MKLLLRVATIAPVLSFSATFRFAVLLRCAFLRRLALALLAFVLALAFALGVGPLSQDPCRFLCIDSHCRDFFLRPAATMRSKYSVPPVLLLLLQPR